MASPELVKVRAFAPLGLKPCEESRTREAGLCWGVICAEDGPRGGGQYPGTPSFPVSLYRKTNRTL